jgi:phosphatidate cytidylyltransferase
MNEKDLAPPAESAQAVRQGLMSRHHLEDLGVRAASGLVLVATAVGSLFAGGWLFVLYWLIAALAVHWEWQRLIGAPLPWLRIFSGGFALCAAAVLYRLGLTELAFAMIPLAATFAAWAGGAGFLLWSGFGLFYAGGLLLAMISLRHVPFFGVCAIGWLFAVVWGTDVCAYFGGRLIGGPKLAPAISPGKTWSGFWVGVVCGAGLGALAAHFWPNVDAPFWPLFLLGLVAGALATCSNPGSNAASTSRIRAASFPAMAASWTGSTALSPPPFSRPCSAFLAGCPARRPACSSGPRISYDPASIYAR